MNETLRFYLDLKDMMSSGLATVARNGKSAFAQVEDAVKKLEGKVSEAANKIEAKFSGAFNKIKQKFSGSSGSGGMGNIIGGVVIGEAISKVIEGAGDWVREGIDLAKQKSTALSQVRSSISSNRGAAGVGLADVENSSKHLVENSPFNEAEIMRMQSVLLTFPHVTKKTFDQASQIVADASVKMHKDLKTTGDMVGRALENPTKGMASLTRMGVTFTAEETKQINNLTAAGKAQQAQVIILDKLNQHFAGSAKAAFDADPTLKFKATMEEIQTTIGGVALALAGKLANAFNKVVDWMKEAWHWFGEHKKIMLVVGVVIGSVAGALALYYGWVQLVTGITKVWAVVQWLLNDSMLANPITWIIAGIIALIALIAGLVYAVKGWATVWDNVVKFAKSTWHLFTDDFKLIWLEIQDTFLTGIELIEKGWYHLKSLWDKEGAKEGLAKINDEQNKRATEIALQKGAMKKDIDDAVAAGKKILTLQGLSVDRNAISGLKNKVKGFFSVSPTDITGGGNGTGGDNGTGGGDGTGKQNGRATASGITSGGPRVININGLTMKLAEKMEIAAMDGKQFLNDMEGAMEDFWLRVLNSGASVQ